MKAIVLMRDGSFRMSEAPMEGPRPSPMIRLYVPRDPRICPKHTHSLDDCCAAEKDRHEWVRLVAQAHGWAVYVQAT